MENECEALPGVAYPGVRDNRSTINTKTGYDDDELDVYNLSLERCHLVNAYEVKAGIGVIASKTVWFMSERLECEVPRYYIKSAV